MADPTPKSPFWHHFRAVIDFAIHVIVGTVIFALIALPAVGLDLAMKQLLVNVSEGIVTLIKIGEYAVVVCDLALFLVYLGKTGWRAMKEF
jgi:hypothetical protein